MAKAEVGTAKYQSKQLKASGLQKLRFYCQLCLKQCRDANGFKNHLNSPSHRGRVGDLSESGRGGSVVEEYTRQFRRDFLRLLRVNHGTKRINANKFYQEYILNDKDHVHMNSTRYGSLTSFVRSLGQAGDVRVFDSGNEDEFSLEIALVDHSQGERELQQRKKQKSLQTDENITMKLINEQVLRGNATKEARDELPPEAPVPITQLKPIKLGLKKHKKVVRARAFDDSDDE